MSKTPNFMILKEHYKNVILNWVYPDQRLSIHSMSTKNIAYLVDCIMIRLVCHVHILNNEFGCNIIENHLFKTVELLVARVVCSRDIDDLSIEFCEDYSGLHWEALKALETRVLILIEFSIYPEAIRDFDEFYEDGELSPWHYYGFILTY